MESYDWKRPNDFIQWWVENVTEKREDTYALAAALIQLNIAGIQSTGMVVSREKTFPYLREFHTNPSTIADASAF